MCSVLQMLTAGIVDMCNCACVCVDRLIIFIVAIVRQLTSVRTADI